MPLAGPCLNPVFPEVFVWNSLRNLRANYFGGTGILWTSQGILFWEQEASRDGRTGLQARARNDIGRDRAFAYLIKVFSQAGSRSRAPDGRKSDHPAASLAYAGSRIALG